MAKFTLTLVVVGTLMDPDEGEGLYRHPDTLQLTTGTLHEWLPAITLLIVMVVVDELYTKPSNCTLQVVPLGSPDSVKDTVYTWEKVAVTVPEPPTVIVVEAAPGLAIVMDDVLDDHSEKT